MIISIGYTYIENYTSPELLQILLTISTVTTDEFFKIEIADAASMICSQYYQYPKSRLRKISFRAYS